MSDKDQDRIRVLRGIMIQSGAELPKAVLNLAKADNLNHKRKIKTTKIEREELSTKLPKRELKASETVSSSKITILKKITLFTVRRKTKMKFRKKVKLSK